MLIARALERLAFGAAIVSVSTLGFEQIDASLPLTQDLRMTNLRAAALLTIGAWILACCAARRWPRVPRAAGLAAAAWLGCVLASALLAPTHQTQSLAFTR